MEILLRILMLEDVEPDARLIQHELSRAGLSFIARRVDTREDFLAELAALGPDLILADYALPSFDGAAALTLAQQICPEVPFIFVSGAIGEERAIQALRNGATDYVLKDHLSRLSPAIQRALQEVEERSRRKTAEAEREFALQALQERGERLELLHGIDRAILTGCPAREIAQLALRHIRQAIPCQRAVVVTFDDQIQQLQVFAVDDADVTRLPAGATVPLTPGGAWQQPPAGAVVDLTTLTDPWPTARLFVASGLRYCVSFSLQTGQGWRGQLSLLAGQPEVFTVERLEFARQVADSLAVAVQHTYLDAAEQHAREVADTLRAANLALTGSLQLDAVLTTLLDYLAQLIPFDSANVMLLEEDGKLRAHAWRGYERWPHAEAVPDIGFAASTNAPISELLRTREPLLIGDSNNCPGWERVRCAEHVRSWLAVPLVATDQVIGLFSVDKAEPDFFTATHAHLAEALAAQAAIAVQNARLFAEVTTGREHLQTLSRRLVQVQEEERRDIARELHDEAGQQLTALTFGLGLVQRHADCAPQIAAELEELKQATQAVMECLHGLAVNLRPTSLDRLGLVAGLRQYIADFERKYRLPVSFEAGGLEGNQRLAAQVEIALYRIIQEALTNVARHAHATHAGVLLQRRAEGVLAIVEDDGIGFDVEEAWQRGRLGLLGMQERIEMLGGGLTIESHPGAGTTVYATVPLSEDSR